MKNKTILFMIIAVIIAMIFTVLFTGCISNNNSDKVANVKLEGFSHHETYELPNRYISALSLNLQNKGNAVAENVNLHIEIKNNNGKEIYNREISLVPSFYPNGKIDQTIDVPYYSDYTQIDVNISISWDGGTNHYTKSFIPEFKEYTDVILENMTHHENYNISNGYTSTVNLLIHNRGNLIANNVKIYVIVTDNNGNQNYNKEENVTSLLLPWEVKNYKIIVPYDLDDKRLDFSITLIWGGGTNHYTKSFEPEFKEYSDVELDSYSHYEHYKLFVGYVSTVNFIFQNKGSETAENVKINIIAEDDDKNELYSSEITFASYLIPGEIKPYETTLPYELDDISLNLYITITWNGGSNNYSESFEPKIVF